MSNQIIANDKYGFPFWPEGINPVNQELFAYSITRGNYAKLYEDEKLKPFGYSMSDFKFEEPVSHLVKAISLLWPEDVQMSVRGYINSPMLRVLEELCTSDDIGIAGNASCVAGSTRLLDAKTGQSHSIKELCDKKKRIWVQTLNGPVLSEVPFLKGTAGLFEVKLSNGATFICTEQHRLLSRSGWMTVSSLSNSDEVFAYSSTPARSNSESCLSASCEDARRYFQTAQGSQSSCSAYFRLCGEQLRDAQAACLDAPPSQVGVQKCNLSGGGEGDFSCELKRIRLHESASPSKRSAARRSFELENLLLPRCFAGTLSQCRISFRLFLLFWLKNILRRTFSESLRHELGKPNMDTESFQREGSEFPCDSECNQSSSLSFQSCQRQGGCFQAQRINEQSRRSCSCFSRLSVSSDLMVTLARVESITSVGVGDFYDLHVPGEEHYFAEGGIHHNSSKTFSCATWLVADWLSAPDKTLSFVASTSLGGSEDRIWGTVAKLFRRATYKIGHLIDHRKIIVFEDPSKDDERDYTNAIKAIAFPSGDEGRKSVETTRGRKNTRVRVVVDELAEMESYVNNVKINLKANVDFVYVGIANPAVGENPHRELCEPDDQRGYESITVRDRKWKTRTGTAIFIHGDDSPNFLAPEDEPPPFPYLLTRKKKADILKACYGDANSMEYWRNVVGFWPLDSIETSVISRSLIKNSDTSYEPAWKSGSKTRIATLDCAWTSGGDRNIVSFGYVAELRDSGKKVLMYQGSKGYSVGVGTIFEESLADNVIPDLEEYGVTPSHFGLDVSGDGGKVLSAFIRRWQKISNSSAMIVPITSSGTPSDKIVSHDDRRKAKEVYDRRVTEYWFSFYHALSSRCIYGIDALEHRDLVNELCARQYSFRGKKMSVETKRDMKKRIGKSPDYADSMIYLWVMAQRFGCEIIVDDKYLARDQEDDEDFEPVEYGSYGGSGLDPDGFG